MSTEDKPEKPREDDFREAPRSGTGRGRKACGSTASRRWRKSTNRLRRRSSAGGSSRPNNPRTSPCRRHVEAERLGGPEIDDRPEFGCLLDRKGARLFALWDAIDIRRRALVEVEKLSATSPPLRNSSTGKRRATMASRRRNDLLAMDHGLTGLAGQHYQAAVRRYTALARYTADPDLMWSRRAAC